MFLTMSTTRNPVVLRSIGVLAAMPSGMALLLHVGGFASLHTIAIWAFLPSLLLLLWVGRLSSSVRDSMIVGAVGGLLGTFGYDLFRVPFMLMGKRVFAPISAYGVWLLDGDRSTALTELAGWSYHFSNGITFGIMYALVATRRSWKWAILWGLALETIVVVSPFADAFALRGAYGALAIAYAGHLAYGYPLGRVVERPARLLEWLRAMPKGAVVFVGGLVLLGVLLPLFQVQTSEPAMTFTATDGHLTPSWLRLSESGPISVLNPGTSLLTVHNHSTGTDYTIAPGETQELNLAEPGIVQLSLTGEGRTRSSFVIVEPVFRQR